MTLSQDIATTHGVDSGPPLYVDLDGTLIASDMLFESLAHVAARDPLALLNLPLWLRSGRPALKHALAERSELDVATLPYRQPVIDYIEAARAAGRRVVLATASDESLAKRVADHLGLFDEVLATRPGHNLKGDAKRAAIVEATGGGAFEYVGDSLADVPIWRHAATATLVAPAPGVEAALARSGRPVPIHTLVAREGWQRAALKAMRPRQWVKNALLFVPLLLAHKIGEFDRLASVALAFASFCCIASSTYVLNDLLDLDADRRHPRKCKRPLAAGTLSIRRGIALVGVLAALGFGASLAALPLAATGMLAAYAILTTAYSFVLKERLFIDVFVLAGLYTHRVLAGGVAGEVPVSPWLLAFSMFFFLSLAFVKRYSELLGAISREQHSLARRGYEVDDLGIVETTGLSSGMMSVLVLALYVNSDAVRTLYTAPTMLWLMCPIMLYWITRVWFLARRGLLSEDPVLFATTDRTSYITGACIAATVVLAAWGPR